MIILAVVLNHLHFFKKFLQCLRGTFKTLSLSCLTRDTWNNCKQQFLDSGQGMGSSRLEVCWKESTWTFSQEKSVKGAIRGWSNGGKALVWEEKLLLTARSCKGRSFLGGWGLESEDNRGCRHSVILGIAVLWEDANKSELFFLQGPYCEQKTHSSATSHWSAAALCRVVGLDLGTIPAYVQLVLGVFRWEP